MCLVALEDPGLTVFPTHRLIGRLDEDRRQLLRRALERDFEIVEVPVEEISPPPGERPCNSATSTLTTIARCV